MNSLATVPIPKPDAHVIFPPNRDHDFFALADTVRFDGGISGFSWANAWWLAEFALLAYDDPANVAAHAARAGFSVCDAEPISHGAAQCYVIRNDDVVIVAFRGTEIVHRTSDRGFLEKTVDVINDVVANVQVAPEVLDDGAWVHHGFNAALEGILDWQLRPLLDEVQGERALWFTGHSLGGALAAVACHYFPDAAGAYTYGAPRVGDARFVNALKPAIWRIVNDNDLVPTVPPARPDPRLRWLEAGYAHPGSAVRFDGDTVTFDTQDNEEPPALLTEAAAVLSSPSMTWRWLRNRLTQSLKAFKDLPSFLASLRKVEGIREMVHGLVDHAPLYYALKTRNALVAAHEPKPVCTRDGVGSSSQDKCA